MMRMHFWPQNLSLYSEGWDMRHPTCKTLVYYTRSESSIISTTACGIIINYISNIEWGLLQLWGKMAEIYWVKLYNCLMVMILFWLQICSLATGIRNGPDRDPWVPNPSIQTPQRHLYYLSVIDMIIIIMLFVITTCCLAIPLFLKTMPSNGYGEWSHQRFWRYLPLAPVNGIEVLHWY